MRNVHKGGDTLIGQKDEWEFAGKQGMKVQMRACVVQMCAWVKQECGFTKTECS